MNLEKRRALQCPIDSVFSSPSPRSADGGRWRNTGRQRGSRGSCNKNKHISCLYSMTTGGRTHSMRSSSSTRNGASPASTPQTLSPTTSPPTELERYLLPLLPRHRVCDTPPLKDYMMLVLQGAHTSLVTHHLGFLAFEKLRFREMRDPPSVSYLVKCFFHGGPECLR